MSHAVKSRLQSRNLVSVRLFRRAARRTWQTLRNVITYLRDDYHIDYVAGHYDFQPDETECPGKHLEVRLPVLAADLRMKFGTGGYVVPEWIKTKVN